MFAVLACALLSAQSPDVWTLDAERAVTVTRVVPGENGADPREETTVHSVPSPFSAASARIVKADGSEVTVAEGIKDAGMTDDDVDTMVKELRRQWIRVTFINLLAGGATLWGDFLALVVFVPGVALIVNGVANLLNIRPLTIPTAGIVSLIIGLGLALIGVLFLLPALALGLFALTRVLRAVVNIVGLNAESMSRGTQWSTETAAEVVRRHNQRLEKKAPPPPEEAPPIIST